MRNEQTRKIEFPVKVAKALADESRMRVMSALVFKDELCVCQMTELLGLAVSTVSRHINLLHTAGLVNSRRQGRWVYYSLSDKMPFEIRSWIEKEIFYTQEAEDDRQELSKGIFCDPEEFCGGEKEKR